MTSWSLILVRLKLLLFVEIEYCYEDYFLGSWMLISSIVLLIFCSVIKHVQNSLMTRACRRNRLSHLLCQGRPGKSSRISVLLLLLLLCLFRALTAWGPVPLPRPSMCHYHLRPSLLLYRLPGPDLRPANPLGPKKTPSPTSRASADHLPALTTQFSVLLLQHPWLPNQVVPSC